MEREGKEAVTLILITAPGVGKSLEKKKLELHNCFTIVNIKYIDSHASRSESIKDILSSSTWRERRFRGGRHPSYSLRKGHPKYLLENFP